MKTYTTIEDAIRPTCSSCARVDTDVCVDLPLTLQFMIDHNQSLADACGWVGQPENEFIFNTQASILIEALRKINEIGKDN